MKQTCSPIALAGFADIVNKFGGNCFNQVDTLHKAKAILVDFVIQANEFASDIWHTVFVEIKIA